MRAAARGTLCLGIVGAVLVLASCVQSTEPQVVLPQSSTELAGDVEVLFDPWGAAHIYADNAYGV